MPTKKTYGPIKAVIAVFDTQDNLVQSTDFWAVEEWVQNLDLETFEPMQIYGLRIISDTKLWVKTKEPVRSVRLSNFPYFHKVKKISNRHFEIECKKLPMYQLDTDYIETLIFK